MDEEKIEWSELINKSVKIKSYLLRQYFPEVYAYWKKEVNERIDNAPIEKIISELDGKEYWTYEQISNVIRNVLKEPDWKNN